MSTQSATWLNYHHLYYFWRVAREGSLSRAAEQLRLSHSTLSTQIRALEEHLNGTLFSRSGRALSLTALGRDILRYADEIFRLGTELTELAGGQAARVCAPLCLGIVSSVPKALAYRMVAPVLAGVTPEAAGALNLHQGRLDELLEQMAAGALHVILSDQPPPQGLALHVYSHVLAEAPVRIYGTPALVRRYAGALPACLQDAPLFLPGRGSGLRARLEHWLGVHEVRVRVMGEFDDPETMRLFGALGHALFPAQTEPPREAGAAADLVPLGELAGLSERFYALVPERRVHRADVQQILALARTNPAEPQPQPQSQPQPRSEI